jgi:hypothetical protein
MYGWASQVGLRYNCLVRVVSMRRSWLVVIACFGLPALSAGTLQCGGSEVSAPVVSSSEGGDDRTVIGDAEESDASRDAARNRGNTHEASADVTLADVGPDVVAQDAREQDVREEDAVEHDVLTGCVSGLSCVPGVCATGSTECSDAGEMLCVPTGSSANGSLCDAGGTVCSDGSCVPCAAGATCASANPCQQAAIACSTGAPVCTEVGNIPDGTSCGTNEVCSGGSCVACTTGMPCTLSNPCQTGGLTSCNTGQESCVATGNVTDGTTCGTSALCCSGVCATCSTSTNATNSCLGTTCNVTCEPGFSMCSGLCLFTISDNNACGASCVACPAGSTCINSSCVAEYGDVAPFSPCNAEAFGPGHLAGQMVTISESISVTNLGVVAAAGGVQGILALYSDVAGSPSALLAETVSASIVAGNNQILVISQVSVSAGNYWIVGEYNAPASICVDGATSNVIDSVAISYGTVPATLGTPTTSTGADINYYVGGILE